MGKSWSLSTFSLSSGINFIKFANKAAEIGKQTGRGLRTFAKFGIIPEAIFIGADTLIRAGMGDTFDEAVEERGPSSQIEVSADIARSRR